jgi:chemotaxis protein methyltransferase CheR
MLEIAPDVFQRIVTLAKARWGIHLTDRKLPLVTNRLNTHLRKTQRFATIADYVDHLERECDEEDMLVFFDILSTNVTSFFRDPQHFHFLERELWTPLVRGAIPCPGRRVRLWSAACSIGCEPYSLAIQALELVPDIDRWDIRILATDLSTKALRGAREGTYPEQVVEKLDAGVRDRYFERIDGADTPRYRVCQAVRDLVTINRLNLMEPFPFKGPFDVIFVRNVMIYFDRDTREQLVRRLAEYLRPNGILTVGGAETLSGLDVPLTGAAASVYRR